MRERLAGQLAPYRSRHREVRWTRPETWHLTLLFLGSVERGRVAELESLIDHVAAGLRSYRVCADAGDGRVQRGEGVAWLGLSDGAGTLIEVAQAVADGAPSDITSGAPPRRTASAHLTVVRKADRTVIEALRSQTHGPLRVEWTVDRIALLRSHLDAAGARYETLAESTL